jgi:hypothetical protein
MLPFFRMLKILSKTAKPSRFKFEYLVLALKDNLKLIINELFKKKRNIPMQFITADEQISNDLVEISMFFSSNSMLHL